MASANKSNEELASELVDLRQELEALKILYNDSVRGSHQKEMDVMAGQEAIKYHNSRLELAVDAVDMAWWDMDVQTGKVLFHKRKAEMLGYAPDCFHHYTDFTTLVHPDDLDGAMKAMHSHLHGLSPTYETEYRIKTSSGEYKWFYDIGTIVKRDAMGVPQKVIGFVMNISKRKLAELEITNKNAELLKINAEKDKFFSIIAHDLRGPLGGLIQITKLISDESSNLSDHEKKELFEALGSSARNSYNLLENLLEWSRIQRGHIEFKPQQMNLKELVNDCTKVLNEPAGHKEIGFQTDIPAEMMVSADGNMLQTVMRNLISNAIKFTRKGGEVTISASQNGSHLTVVSVKDTGIGMTNELRNNLFHIDFNTKRPGTNGEQSTGLGLQLCKEFIEKHGGTIWVESEVEKGSIFSFTLPSL